MAGQILQQKIKMDGIGQVLYFFYPHVPAGGWEILDWSLPMAKATCESMNDANYQCYFVDTRDTFRADDGGSHRRRRDSPECQRRRSSRRFGLEDDERALYGAVRYQRRWLLHPVGDGSTECDAHQDSYRLCARVRSDLRQ